MGEGISKTGMGREADMSHWEQREQINGLDRSGESGLVVRR